MDMNKKYPAWVRTIFGILALAIIGGVIKMAVDLLTLLSGPVGEPEKGILFQLAGVGLTIVRWASEYTFSAVVFSLLVLVIIAGLMVIKRRKS